MTDVIGEIERLRRLRDEGSITDQQFEEEKARLLSGDTKTVEEPSEEGGSGCKVLGCTAVGTVAVLFLLLVLAGVVLMVVFDPTRPGGVDSVQDLLPAAVRGPVHVVDAVENLSAGSWKAIPFTLDYDGELQVNVRVLRGNALEIAIVPPASIEAKKSGDSIRHYPNFHADSARELRQTHGMAAGTYYLLLEDHTLGLLSESASDIDIDIWLNP